MLLLIVRNLLRRALRNGLTLAGIAAASAVLVCIVAFGEGYRRGLRTELDRSGVQMMLVPLGCPYDAAARVLKNNTLEHSLPVSAWEQARADRAVATAAPLLMAALPRRDGGQMDQWVGLDESALQLKPWWQARSGQRWFTGTNEAILGAEIASVEMRQPGDKLFTPETGREFRVAGVLARSGTGDDNAIFVPLAVAQEMFGQAGRLTGVAIRLRDPALVREAAPRLQQIPGAQVVTMSEMMGTFLNLIGAVRTLVLAVGSICMTVSALTVFNTLLAAVLERTAELSTMRAIGASRTQVFALVAGEALLLSIAGVLAGTALALMLGPQIEVVAKGWIPSAPAGTLMSISGNAVVQCQLLAVGIGVLAGMYPAWRAATLPSALGSRLE
jgi:putative ABC transport system permease protein